MLSLLFHDVGKWRDEDHATESVRMARLMLDRLDLPAESRDTVEFLIANHLRMSQIAFRRDTEDPEVVRQFAALVGIEERLKMLCLMTLADVAAVSPETLTPWKAELLWRLYVDTYNQLTLGYGDELIQRDQAGLAKLLAGRPADLAEPEVTAFLEGLPRRYLQSFTRDAIYRHVRLSRDIHPDEIHVSLEQKGSAWELAVVTLDKPFLFSNISGVLSSFGMDILRGHAMTSPNGLVLDIFQFTDRERFLELNPDAKDQFLHVLDEVVSGPLGCHRAAARPRAGGVPSPPRGAVRPGDSLRQPVVAALHDPRYHHGRRPRAALPDQPRDLPERLRRRSGPHFNRRREGDRRVSPHQSRSQAVRGGAARAHGQPATHAGGRR